MTRLVLVLAAGCAVAAIPPAASARQLAAYAYGGVQSRVAVTGIAATVSPVAAPAVRSGHVAAWVGVGGGSAWLQVGVNAVARGGSAIYEEWKSGGAYKYVELRTGIRVGEQHRVAIVATGSNRWQAFVDGKRAGQAFALASDWMSPAQATAETFTLDGGCNAFAYRLADVRQRVGTAWRRLTAPLVFRDAPLSLSARDGTYRLTARC